MNPGDAAAGLDAGAAVPAGRRGRCCTAAWPAAATTATRASPSSSTALAAALGPVAAGPATQPWLDRDPELTQPGPAAHRRSRTERRCPSRTCRGGAVAGSRCSPLVGRPRAGRRRGSRVRRAAPARADRADRHRRHAARLSVTVPADWDRADATDGLGARRTPTAPASRRSRSAPAQDWATEDGSGEGVFVALLPSTELPEQVPQHPECDDRRPGRRRTARTATTRARSSTPTAPAAASSSSGSSWSPPTPCCGSRSAATTAATANQVLDDVETHGI